MDYTKLSILEVSKLLHDGSVTSEELTKQVLNNIKQKQNLHALTSVCEEYALKKHVKLMRYLKRRKVATACRRANNN